MQREQSGQTFGCRQWRPHNVSRPTAPAISFWVTVCERWSLKHFRFDQPGSFRRENFSNRPGKIARQALIWASAADWRAACSFSIVFQGLVRLGKVVALIASGLRIKLTLLIRYRRRGGSWRNMDAAGRNLLDEPKVNGMVINFRDITERQKAEEALKSREALLRAVVENAWDGVVVFDEDTPLALVRLLAPDVIVKGGDYRPDTIVGADDVVARGGRVVVIPLTAGQSTTSIIEKLRG